MTIGVHTSSFQSLLAPGSDPVDVLVRAMTACGARECELLAPQIEARFGGPHGGHDTMSAMSPQMMRRELRKWRLRTPDSYFQAIGSRFQNAGVAIRAYHYSPDASFTDQEIDRGFAMARALGAGMLTASPAPGLAARIAPFAAQHRMAVGLAGDNVETSPYLKIVVDAARLASAKANAAAYVRDHHADIAILRVRCGETDGPARQAIEAIARGGWPIPVFVELRGHDSPVDGVKRCLAALGAG
jgi:hypothetical protein